MILIQVTIEEESGALHAFVKASSPGGATPCEVDFGNRFRALLDVAIPKIGEQIGAESTEKTKAFPPRPGVN